MVVALFAPSLEAWIRWVAPFYALPLLLLLLLALSALLFRAHLSLSLSLSLSGITHCPVLQEKGPPQGRGSYE